MANWLKSNPGFSRVQDVKIEEVKDNLSFEGFEIVKQGNLLEDQAKSARNLGKKILKL